MLFAPTFFCSLLPPKRGRAATMSQHRRQQRRLGEEARRKRWIQGGLRQSQQRKQQRRLGEEGEAEKMDSRMVYT